MQKYLILLVLLLTACSSTAVQTAPPVTEQPAAVPANLETSAPEATPAVKPPASPTPEAVSETASAAPTAVSEAPLVDETAPLLPEAAGSLPDLSAAPRYAIDLEIDFDQHAFAGQAVVDYTNMEDIPLDELYFRLLPNGGGSYGDGALAVENISVNGAAAQTELTDADTVLIINLGQTLEPGDAAQIAFDFAGVVPEDFGETKATAGYGIYNFTSEIMTLASWYPILAVYDDEGWNLDPVSSIGDSVYSDMAFYSVAMTVPEEVVVAATGSRTDAQTAGGQTQILFESGPARDFFIAMSPNFEVIRATVSGTTVNSYYLPGHTSGGRMASEIAADSLAVFNEQFGAYPYAELDLVEIPMRYAAGVEYPGIILIAENMYDGPASSSFTITIAHEVAHQWWYNIVGNDVFDEPWLDEALTTYSSSLYYEFERGMSYAQGLVDYWAGHYETIRARSGDYPVTEDLEYFENTEDAGAYSAIVYSKGALFFHELRQEIGDEAFFEALHSYFAEQQYQIADAEDLLDAFERAAEQQLDSFYQEWLY